MIFNTGQFQGSKFRFFVLVAFVIMLPVGAYAGLSVYYREQLDSHQHASLQMLVREKAKHIDTFFNFQKEKLSVLAASAVFSEVAVNPDNPVKIETAKKRIAELRGIIPGITITNEQGIVIVGDIDSPGTDYSQQPYFSLKEKRIVFERYYDVLRKKDYFAVVGPLYDTTDTGKIIGVIAFDVELDKLSDLMKETVDSGRDEVYLIDGTGLLLSGSEYIGKGNKNGILIQEVKSKGAEDCLMDLKKYGVDGVIQEHEEEGENEDEEGLSYLNYMGDRVIGVHAYAPSIMGCVIAEERIGEVSGLESLLLML